MRTATREDAFLFFIAAESSQSIFRERAVEFSPKRTLGKLSMHHHSGMQ
jgi:hypothetical protein